MGVSQLTFETALDELMEDSAGSATGGDTKHTGSNNQTRVSFSQGAFDFGIQNGAVSRSMRRSRAAASTSTRKSRQARHHPARRISRWTSAVACQSKVV